MKVGIMEISSKDSANRAFKNPPNENKTDVEFQTGKLSILIDDKDSIHMKGPVSEIKEVEFKL